MRSAVRLLRQRLLRARALCGHGHLEEFKSILVIAPHPDDEVFGCGGLIVRTLTEGGQVHVIVLTDGEHSHHSCCDLSSGRIRHARRDLAVKAAKPLSLDKNHITFLDWGDGQLTDARLAEIEQKVDELACQIRCLQPQVVFVPHPFEGWADHMAAELLTRSAIERSGITCKLFHYCVWFWFSMLLRRAFRVDWRRARLLDIRDVYSQKQAAMYAYLEPCAPCGNPWSGVLPPELLRAFRWNKELFFEADVADGTCPPDQISAGTRTEQT